MPKYILDRAYYLYYMDALGYWEASNLITYYSSLYASDELIKELFRAVERMERKGVQPKEFPSLLNCSIFN